MKDDRQEPVMLDQDMLEVDMLVWSSNSFKSSKSRQTRKIDANSTFIIRCMSTFLSAKKLSTVFGLKCLWCKKCVRCGYSCFPTISDGFRPVSDLVRHAINFHTSSAAQGGGGSFKKRKTIGEIGCCESRMSKQKHGPID